MDTSNTDASKQHSTLGDRMKTYESVTESQLKKNLPAILRVDGHKFSTFTTGFDRPFDIRLHNAMVETCKDLLKQFPSATFIYTQSDEITMIFPHGLNCFNDRVQKVASLAAGFTSCRFNAHLQTQIQLHPNPPAPLDKIGWAYFDGRLFNVPSTEECLNNIIWRCKFDCVRNGISACARQYYSMKELHKKEKTVMVEMLKEKGVEYHEFVPKWGQEGTMVKREQFEMEGTDFKSGEVCKVLRTRMKAVDGGILVYSDENLRIVVEKYWNSEFESAA